jgi:hypothetical protein
MGLFMVSIQQPAMDSSPVRCQFKDNAGRPAPPRLAQPDRIAINEFIITCIRLSDQRRAAALVGRSANPAIGQ